MTTGIEIRPLQEGDEASLLGTFEAAFGRGRSLDAWRWAFQQNPAGTQVQVAVRAGEVVAQYAALPSRVWMDGQSRIFSQVVDSMVHPKERRGLSRRGVFADTAASFFETHALGQSGGGETSMFYGWPVPANLRIGERLLGYEREGRQFALVLPLERRAQTDHHDRSTGVVELHGFDEQARWLWERCAPEMEVGTVRDEHWLLWRYLRHPEHRYTCLGVRDRDGILRGLVVARPVEHLGKRVTLVADWLIPSSEPEVASSLLVAVQSRAIEWGSEALALWMPPFSPWFGWLQSQGFGLHTTPWQRITRSFERRVNTRLLREGWWYQLGDSDLV